MSEPLRPHVLLAGRYRLGRLLGEGGMGQVWSATHTVTRQHVAVKVLHAHATARADVRERFLREARASSSVVHPAIVRVHDFFELPDGAPVMVMDLLEGETLGQRLAHRGALGLRETALVLLPVVSAVAAAHAAGVVHRDIKPDNVFLVTGDETKASVRVLDFGIAKLLAGAAEADGRMLTEDGTLLGTPAYMSPEQAFGEQDVDHRTDVWSLGVIAYECLTGVRPVEGQHVGHVLKQLTTVGITPVEVLAPAVPADLARLIGRMLCRDRALRPPLDEVGRVLASIAAVAAPGAPADPSTTMDAVTTDVTAPSPAGGILLANTLAAPAPEVPRDARPASVAPPAHAAAVASGEGAVRSRPSRRHGAALTRASIGLAVLSAIAVVAFRPGASGQELPSAAGAGEVGRASVVAPAPAVAPAADVVAERPAPDDLPRTAPPPPAAPPVRTEPAARPPQVAARRPVPPGGEKGGAPSIAVAPTAVAAPTVAGPVPRDAARRRRGLVTDPPF